MANNAKYRHEFKYQSSEAQLAIVQNRIKHFLEQDPHAPNGQYTIRSIYFDDHQNRCFHENQNGISPREKFRIRVYDANSTRIVLECKRKENDKTLKTSCLLTLREYEEILQGGSFDQFDQKSDLLRRFTVLLKTQQYRPVVIVEYDRTPYIYPAGNVRITFDRNIRLSTDFDHFLSANIVTRPILPPGQHLLEVKYDELLPSFIEDMMQLNDLQRTTFSKFYLCRTFSTGGPL